MGKWTYFNYFTHDSEPSRLDADVAELLRDVVAPAADRYGDTVIAIQAIKPRLHIGILVNTSKRFSFRFVKRDGRWVNIAY